MFRIHFFWQSIYHQHRRYVWRLCEWKCVLKNANKQKFRMEFHYESCFLLLPLPLCIWVNFLVGISPLLNYRCANIGKNYVFYCIFDHYSFCISLNTKIQFFKNYIWRTLQVQAVIQTYPFLKRTIVDNKYITTLWFCHVQRSSNHKKNGKEEVKKVNNEITINLSIKLHAHIVAFF